MPPTHTHVKVPGGLHFRGRVRDRETGTIEKRTVKKEIISASKEKDRKKGQKRKDNKHNDEGVLKWCFVKKAINKNHSSTVQ
jgi:hypothetical protein